MIGLGLDLSLRNYATGVSYVKLGRVLDLSTNFSELTFTLADQSGEGNDATLYTGRYVSTDGVTDKAINADCSAAGSGNYYLTGKIKPVGTTAVANLNGSPINLTGLSAGVWQDFTSDTKTGITPDNVVVGWNGASNYSAADWSDVRLIDASDGSTVARWQLTESADGDLNGYPALDSSGNGYHGTHTGCAGGTGEAGILQTAGQDWNKLPYFSSADTEFVSFTPVTLSGDRDVSFTFYVETWNGAVAGAHFLADSTGSARIAYDSTISQLSIFDDSGSVSAWRGLPITTGHFYEIGISRASGTWSLLIDGVDQGAKTDGAGATGNITIDSWARKRGTATSIGSLNGIIYDINIGSAAWSGAYPYTDTTGSNNGTVNGSPSNVLIPESTTAGTDALGNAIAEPRVNSKQLNLFGDGEYAEVADADSLDLTTAATWEIWVDATNPSTQTLFSKDAGTGGFALRGWRIYFNGTAGQVRFASHDTAAVYTVSLPNLTTGIHCLHFVKVGSSLTGYTDGASVVVGTAADPLNVTTTAALVGAQGNLSGFAARKIGSPKIYNRALTADEVLQNFQSQKSQYGL